MWLTICSVLIAYISGFFLGKKCIKDDIMDGVCGVMSQINKNTMMVDSVTYYYTTEAYDAELQRIKELGEEYYEEDVPPVD